jgi:hypothetical protein
MFSSSVLFPVHRCLWFKQSAQWPGLYLFVFPCPANLFFIFVQDRANHQVFSPIVGSIFLAVPGIPVPTAPRVVLLCGPSVPMSARLKRFFACLWFLLVKIPALDFPIGENSCRLILGFALELLDQKLKFL